MVATPWPLMAGCCAMSDVDHGFRSIVVFPGHGGSAVSYEPVVSPLTTAFTGSVLMTTNPSVVSPTGDTAMGWWHEPDAGPSAATTAGAIHAVQYAGGRWLGSVVVIGFSQGAAMATMVAHLPEVAAVVLISGFLPHPRPTDPVTAQVLSMYGDADEVIDPFLSQMAARWLSARGAEVTVVSHVGGHAWSPAVTEAIVTWLRDL